MSGQYPKQMNPSAPRNYPRMPQPPVPPMSPGNASGYPPAVVGNMHFQNPNYHFQQYPPTLMPPVSPSPVQAPANSIQNSCRPLFNTPPPSAIPPGSMIPMQRGQFNFPPPPPIPSSSSYLPQGYSNPPSSFPNNHSQQYFNNTSMQSVFPNVVPPQTSSSQHSTMSRIISNIMSTSTAPDNGRIVSEKENLLNEFLQKFNSKEKQKTKSDITVAEFRCVLKRCFSLFSLLQRSRENLALLINSNEKEWELELRQINELQDKLSETCSVLSNPDNLAVVQRKLKSIKRKRALKKRLKAESVEERTKKEQERERLHQEIDKWFDNLKEKNEKMKRELEMKKEADNILAEVRRKIHEAKKTIEKLKVFEKLRSARQASSVQKGLYPQPEHTAKFEAKMSHLREMMLAQLSNYEQEERALQVMLETEQEDRREEEALWRKRKLMTFQQKKQKVILESLFGHSDEPAPDDPLFLFYQYQNSGNKSIENLIQIRHHWDVHLSDEGESIPLQWVVPVPANSSSWEEHCLT